MIVISSGHGKYVPGASGPEPWGLDEVHEARRVADELCTWLLLNGHKVEGPINDDVSHNQSDNLHWIVLQHNSFPAAGRLDVSIHFNAYTPTTGARGTECLYASDNGKVYAARVAPAISSASGLVDRGAHYRSDLYFLNKTTGELGAILVEVCFVDAETDIKCYEEHFEHIAAAIGDAIAPALEEEPVEEFRKIGLVSWFGGKDDQGVTASEGLAMENEGCNPEEAPELFYAEQPPNTTGNARRLDSEHAFYLAMRWDYEQFSKDELASGDLRFDIYAPKTGRHCSARPADWGPNTSTGRVCDVSKAVLKELQIETDDEVEITLVS
jgi:hypothetical protein